MFKKYERSALQILDLGGATTFLGWGEGGLGLHPRVQKKPNV